MKTLVIHPFDLSTGFLETIYSEMECTVISNIGTSKKVVVAEIKKHDRIIMLGHGTKDGLIAGNRFIINSQLVYLLRDKLCVCIWCNADEFVKKYKLRGFYTGMIISDMDEANYFCNHKVTDGDIQFSNILFSESIRNVINKEDMVNGVLENYVGDNHIIDFNRERIYQTYL